MAREVERRAQALGQVGLSLAIPLEPVRHIFLYQKFSCITSSYVTRTYRMPLIHLT